MGKNGSLTYADSGVNIDTGNQVVSAIKSIIKDAIPYSKQLTSLIVKIFKATLQIHQLQ